MIINNIGLITGACASIVTGGILVPNCAHALLVYKYNQINDYWLACCNTYLDYSATGTENSDMSRELALWQKDTYRLLSNHCLPREYAHLFALAQPNVQEQYDFDMLPSLDERKQFYCGKLPEWWCAACGVICTMVFFALSYLHMSAPAHAVSLFALCFCMIMALTDAKAHILPYEMTLGLIPVGICVQAVYVLCGLTTPLFACIGAALYCLILFGSCGLTKIMTHLPVTGQGDIRATPGFALVCANAPFVSLGTVALCMGAALIVFRIKKTKTLTDRIAFGPFLFLGTAAGLVFGAAFMV